MEASKHAAPAPMPSTMRGWVRQHRGHYSSSLKLVDNLPTPPDPGPESSDIIVRVSYTALEYSIVHLMASIPSIPFTPPLINELCVSGTVAVAGGRAPKELQQVGARVLAMTDPFSMFFRGSGALVEYMRLPQAYVAPLLPQSENNDSLISLAQGAGLISNGSTAMAMVRAAGVRSGQRVLVNGASGSVGHIAAQLCLSRGALVTGVASGVNEALVRGYGIHQFINYEMHDLLPDYLASAYQAQPFDSILDCVGSQSLYDSSPRYLHPTGSLVNVGALDMRNGLLRQLGQWLMNSWCPTWLGGTPRSYIMFSNTPNLQEVLTLVEMVQQGRLKVLIDSEFAMEDLVKAYDRVTSKRARGKVLIQIRPE